LDREPMPPVDLPDHSLAAQLAQVVGEPGRVRSAGGTPRRFKGTARSEDHMEQIRPAQLEVVPEGLLVDVVETMQVSAVRNGTPRRRSCAARSPWPLSQVRVWNGRYARWAQGGGRGGAG